MGARAAEAKPVAVEVDVDIVEASAFRSPRANGKRLALGAAIVCCIGAAVLAFFAGRASRNAPFKQAIPVAATGSVTTAPIQQPVRAQKPEDAGQPAVALAQPSATASATAKEEPPPEAEKELQAKAAPGGKPHEAPEEGRSGKPATGRATAAPTPAEDQGQAATDQTAAKPTAKIDSVAAREALAEAAAAAQSCRSANSPSGIARVTVTFTSTGQAVSASVAGPPFAGTLEGKCITAKFRALQIPPFVGDDVSVRKNVNLE